MEYEEVQTYDDLCDYIEKYADYIYVREKGKDGKWDSFALTQLCVKVALKHVFRFLKEGNIPLRLKTEEEMKASK